MSSSYLVAADGKLSAGALPGTDANVTTTVVAALGARGVGQSSLLNAIFGSSLPAARRSAKQTTVGVAVVQHVGDQSAAQVAPPRRIVALDVEGYDGVDRSREEARDRAANLVMAMANVVMFSVRMNDLPRTETNGVASLRVSLTEALKLQESGVTPDPINNRAFWVVIRDYDAEVLPREELINGFLREMQTVYDAMSKPARTPTRVSELFDFEFITLPSAILASEDFRDSLEHFRERVTDPFGDEYLFESGGYAHRNDTSLIELASSIWNALEEQETQDLPVSKELMATFECGNVSRKVFEKFTRGVRDWDRETDDGNVIEDFGSASMTLLDETLAVYDLDAAPHRTSKAFQRKREELKEKIDQNLYELFMRQTLKLREVAYGMFKEKLEDTSSDEPGFEKSINKALKDAQKYFADNAEKLRPKFSAWRFDNETQELASHMREDATERLQQARLEEYAPDARGRRTGRRGRRGRRPGAGPTRQPISISFHYLDPAPFGFKDSRYEKLNTDDHLEYGRDSRVLTGDSVDTVPALPILPGKNEAWDRDYIYQDKPGSGGR
jgi:Root hair defective 3 GTP-binding protein (RHD3)